MLNQHAPIPTPARDGWRKAENPPSWKIHQFVLQSHRSRYGHTYAAGNFQRNTGINQKAAQTAEQLNGEDAGLFISSQTYPKHAVSKRILERQWMAAAFMSQKYRAKNAGAYHHSFYIPYTSGFRIIKKDKSLAAFIFPGFLGSCGRPEHLLLTIFRRGAPPFSSDSPTGISDL